MKVEQLYTGCLAQGAYYIESNGEALLIFNKFKLASTDETIKFIELWKQLGLLMDEEK